MLILSRQENEEIVIGDEIRIVITKIAGNRVFVGVEAPKDVPVRRAEVPPQELQQKGK